MKIEFGCGDLRPLQDGFIGCDIRPGRNTTFVCQAWDIVDHVKENSVIEIYSRHMFEHLTFCQGEKTLSAWHNILMPGARVHLILPDLAFHIDQYASYKNDRTYKKEGMILPEFQHAIVSIFGWQHENSQSDDMHTADCNLWDVHKSGYDEVSLHELVKNTGFVDFVRLPNQKWHLDVEFKKC